MTYIAFLGGRTALAAAVMSGAALIISCAGTLDDKDQYLTGGDDGPGSGSGQGNGATTGGTDPTTSGGDPTTTGGGGDPTTTGGDPTTTGGGGDPTTSASTGGGTGCDEAPALVMSKCATSGCHDATTKLAGLDLSTGWETRAAGQAVDCGGNAMVLVPGDPEASLMYKKVTPAPPCDNRMPLGAPKPLEESEMKCLYDYIAALPK